jgi:hypothetical protein
MLVLSSEGEPLRDAYVRVTSAASGLVAGTSLADWNIDSH